jgi:hypothetical protein
VVLGHIHIRKQKEDHEEEKRLMFSQEVAKKNTI